VAARRGGGGGGGGGGGIRKASQMLPVRIRPSTPANRHANALSTGFGMPAKKYPKAKHRFTFNDAAFLAIAGPWRDEAGNRPPSFAMLTTEPNISSFTASLIVVPILPTDCIHPCDVGSSNPK
jgi:hypothetical protein